jgi:hypothetical protein
VYVGCNIGIDISTLEGKFKNTGNYNIGIEMFSNSAIHNLEQQIDMLYEKMYDAIVDKNKALAKLFATNDINLFAKVQFDL